MNVIHASTTEVVIRIFGSVIASYRCPESSEVAWDTVRRATLQDDSCSRIEEPLTSRVGKQRLCEAKRMAVGVFTSQRKRAAKKRREQATAARQFDLFKEGAG